MSGPLSIDQLAAVSRANVRRLLDRTAADHAALAECEEYAALVEPLQDCQHALAELAEHFTAEEPRR